MSVLQTGDLLHGRYRIVRLLGQGGFGALYRVWDTTLGRPCALKENLDTAPDTQRQFLREAKILANLHHPNLPRVTDYFIENQKQYLVMDFVEGQDLQEMLDDRGGPLPEDQALNWVRQICDALTYLHKQKPPVIHRDIKPANIKVTPSGQAVLVDFGIAKQTDPHLKTTVGAQAVTPGFSPYEQYGKGITDARTDVYALGATLYTLLTGQEPPESVQRVVRDPLLLPRSLNPALSARTSAALARALQMDPTQRFQSVADFKAALTQTPLLHPAPASLTTAAPPVTLPGKAPGWGRTASLARFEWIAWAGGGLLLVLVLLYALRNRPATPSTQPEKTMVVIASGPAYGETTLIAAPRTTTLVGSTLTAPPQQPTTSTTTAVEIAAPYTLYQDYIVQAGDTCSEIAQRFGASVNQILSANGLGNCDTIFTGQHLTVPLPILPETPAPETVEPVATMVAERDGMVMVYVPSGEFAMGSATNDPTAGEEEKPSHAVYLSVYWIDRTEVTNGMYSLCVQAGVCRPPSQFGSATRAKYYGEALYYEYPVIHVSWKDAQTYCNWARRRLPTEAEWEKAARGLDGRPYPWGDRTPGPAEANFNKQVGDTTPVGSYLSGVSPYGALDMAGNVAEWVGDWYEKAYYLISGYKNPVGPEEGEFRVQRGGSWYNGAGTMRAAFRLWNYPELTSETIGFRCAR